MVFRHLLGELLCRSVVWHSQFLAPCPLAWTVQQRTRILIIKNPYKWYTLFLTIILMWTNFLTYLNCLHLWDRASKSHPFLSILYGTLKWSLEHNIRYMYIHYTVFNEQNVFLIIEFCCCKSYLTWAIPKACPAIPILPASRVC